MENKFTFDDSINPATGKKRHIYKLNGKRMTGITTVLQTIAKPMLIPWAAKMAVEYIKKDIDKRIKKSTDIKSEPMLVITDDDEIESLYKTLEEAKNAHRHTKEKAGELGTNVHGIIEGLINSVMESNNGFILEETESKEKQVQHFIDWALKHKVKFLSTEQQLYSKELFVAGTCDFICEIDGEKFVGDLKTSGAIYAEYLYQVGAYRMMLEEMGEKDFSGAIIVRLGKDGKFDEDKDVAISYHYEDEKKAFLSALNLYRIGNSFKKNKFNNSL